MTWFKVDDRFHSHPKVVVLSMTARGLWVTAGSWCADHETDGFVPTAMLRVFGGKKRTADELESAGLWKKLDTGWQFHDWKEYQPTAGELDKKREKTREKLRSWRSRNPVTDEVTEGVTYELQNLPPSRPVPSRPDPELTTTQRAHEDDRALASIGHDTMFNATGRQFALSDWRTQLERIGMKPVSERAAVERSLLACAFRRDNPTAVTPAYALKHWDRYAAGNPPLKQVVRANTPRRGIGPVGTPEEYAADAAGGIAPWEK